MHNHTLSREVRSTFTFPPFSSTGARPSGRSIVSETIQPIKWSKTGLHELTKKNNAILCEMWNESLSNAEYVSWVHRGVTMSTLRSITHRQLYCGAVRMRVRCSPSNPTTSSTTNYMQQESWDQYRSGHKSTGRKREEKKMCDVKFCLCSPWPCRP